MSELLRALLLGALVGAVAGGFTVLWYFAGGWL